MRSAGACSACRLVMCGMVVPLIFLGSSCARKDKEPEQKQAPAPAQEPAATPASAGRDKPGQEERERKESVADVRSVLEEVKKLRAENEALKQAVAEIPALKKGLEKLTQENESLRSAAAAATHTLELLSSALAEATGKSRAGTDLYSKYKVRSYQEAGVLLAKYDAAGDVKAKLAFLDSLGDAASRKDAAVVAVVRRALADPNSSVARAAIKLLEDYETPEVLPAVEQALGTADEQIRLAAVESLDGVNDPQAVRLLTQALNDTSPQVRAAALETVHQCENDSLQLSMLEQGLASPFPEVKRGVASMLVQRSDPLAVDLLLEGFKDPDPAFRAQIREDVSFLIDQDFQTYEQAHTWWTQNKNKYDADLILKDDPVEQSTPAGAKKQK